MEHSLCYIDDRIVSQYRVGWWVPKNLLEELFCGITRSMQNPKGLNYQTRTRVLKYSNSLPQLEFGGNATFLKV